MDRKVFIINIAAMLLFSLCIRIYVFQTNGMIYFGDSIEYLEVIRNISEEKGFSQIDIVTNKILPYANKPPLFFYTVALTKYITTNFENGIFILNIISSILIILLSIKFSLILSSNKVISLMVGWMMTLNPNLIFNSFLLMPDTYYSLVIIIFTFIGLYTLKEKKSHLFLVLGMFLGITVLTRSLLKFFWIFISLFILFYIKKEIKQKLKYIFLFIFGYAIIVLPYQFRNFTKLGVFSPLELHQGIASIWPVMPLIKVTDYSSLFKKYPRTQQIINFIKDKDYEIPPEKDLRLKFKLSQSEMAKYLTLIAIHTAIKHPIKYFKIYIKSILNTITSSSSYLMLIDIFNPGYFEKQHSIFLNFINNNFNTENFKNFINYILPNLFFRLLNLLIFITAIAGIILYNRIGKKDTNLYPVVLLFYTIVFSSFTVGYDRYRLPAEFIILFYSSYFIYERFIKYSKINF
ncbi:MAG: hypothetical protein K6357_02155 [Elusimicrobiota bacterium]